jgi:hypothetical protein
MPKKQENWKNQYANIKNNKTNKINYLTKSLCKELYKSPAPGYRKKKNDPVVKQEKDITFSTCWDSWLFTWER